MTDIKKGRPDKYTEIAQQLISGIITELLLPTRNEALGLVRVIKRLNARAIIRSSKSGHKIIIIK